MHFVRRKEGVVRVGEIDEEQDPVNANEKTRSTQIQLTLINVARVFFRALHKMIHGARCKLKIIAIHLRTVRYFRCYRCFAEIRNASLLIKYMFDQIYVLQKLQIQSSPKP